MRVPDYFRIGIKDLRRQRLRSGLTIVALLISTVILITMAAISIGGRKAIVNQLSPNSALTNIIVTPNQTAGTISPFGTIQKVNQQATKLDDGVVAKLAKLPHVTSVTPEEFIWEFNNFTVAGSTQQFVAQTYGTPGGSALPVSTGSGFTPNDDRHVVVLGLAYAQELGFGNDPQTLIGKTITFTTQKGYRGSGANIPSATATSQQNDAFNQTTTTITAKIVGITTEGSNQSSLFIPMNWARAVRTINYQTPGGPKSTDQIAENGYTTLNVTVDKTANVKGVAVAISSLGFGEISTLDELQRLEQFSTTMWVILGAVAIIAVVAAALGVVNTMLMTVSEQRYVIGVWRAAGAQRGLIVRQFVLEAGLMGFVSGAVGVAIGLLVIRFINDHISSLLKVQHINLSLTNVAAIPAWLIAGTIVLTTLFSAFAGLYPAYRAARQDPSEILRGSDA